jgi:hypothetical protein
LPAEALLLSGVAAVPPPRRRNRCCANLLDPRATPLDQDDQNDDEQYAADNLNDGGVIHVFLSFSVNIRFVAGVPRGGGTEPGPFPLPDAVPDSVCGSRLLDPGAAALDQNDQNDDKQYAADDLNDGGAIHVFLSFMGW